MHAPTTLTETQSRDILNELLIRHYKISLRTAQRILRSREDSEDAVQTAYLAVLREFESFRGESSFRTWVTRIVINCCLAQLRERRARPQIPLEDIQLTLKSNVPSPEALCYLCEMQARHKKAASRLSGPLREVYEPCVVSGLKFTEVARQLGLTTVAAKSRLFRARRKVKNALNQPPNAGRHKSLGRVFVQGMESSCGRTVMFSHKLAVIVPSRKSKQKKQS